MGHLQGLIFHVLLTPSTQGGTGPQYLAGNNSRKSEHQGNWGGGPRSWVYPPHPDPACPLHEA